MPNLRISALCFSIAIAHNLQECFMPLDCLVVSTSKTQKHMFLARLLNAYRLDMQSLQSLKVMQGSRSKRVEKVTNQLGLSNINH